MNFLPFRLYPILSEYTGCGHALPMGELRRLLRTAPMDGKVSEPMAFRNKNATKVLESSTPRASNRLVRMRPAV